MSDPLKPSAQLLAKLAAVVVHAEEWLSIDGHDFDRIALQGCLSDPEVRNWVEAMGPLAPVRRDAR